MTPTDEVLARQVADLPADVFADRLAWMAPDQIKGALWLRFRFDYEGFCRYMWPERFDLAFNTLHRSLLSRSDAPGWRYRVENTRDAVAAPRGYAKSTISCFAQVIHAIVYDLEACIVLLSAGQRLALAQVKDIKTAMENQESNLWDLYGPIRTEGPISEFLVAAHGHPLTAILPGSFGSDVRGWRHPTRGIRPGLVIVDDGEKKDRVRNPEQRRIWWDFLTKDVDKLGPRGGGMRLWVRGTVLHMESMLSRALSHPGFRAEKWRAIIEWPDHPEMWAECSRIWCDLTNSERRRDSRAFYDAHRAKMDAGVIVLDPSTEGVYQLYTEIWGGGLAAFLQEKQNDPRDPSASVFDLARFARCRIVGDKLITADKRTIKLSALTRRGMRWDPALGDAAGDFSALAVGLRDQYGYTYVVDGWLRKAKPSEQLAAMWSLAERWGIRRVSLESNGFQSLLGDVFRREREARRATGKFWQVDCHEEPSTDNKEMRIAAMEPDCHNGWIQFAERLPPEGDGQFGDFPSGAHDDWPDAVEGMWRRLGGSPAQMERRPQRRIR